MTDDGSDAGDLDSIDIAAAGLLLTAFIADDEEEKPSTAPIRRHANPNEISALIVLTVILVLLVALLVM